MRQTPFWAWCLPLLIMSSCDSQPTSRVRAAPPPSANRPVAATEPGKGLVPPRLPSFAASSFPAGRRTVAIGDLHGDVEATRGVLRLAGATDGAGQWVGGDLVVVQTGDQLDRGDTEKEILDLLDRLEAQAKAAGGAVHVLNGNHETMNAGGDFRYVTAGGFREFEGSDSRMLPASVLGQLPEHTRARAAAFFPGGRYAKMMSRHRVIAIVGDSVFAHGGVLYKHVTYGIDRLNAEVRRWLLGDAAEPRVILTPEAPVWSRLYSEGTPDSSACAELALVLDALKAKRMVVGHTVQNTGISSACNDRVWRIDVGMSAHYGGTHLEALEIQDGKVRVLRQAKSALEATPLPTKTRKVAAPTTAKAAE